MLRRFIGIPLLALANSAGAQTAVPHSIAPTELAWLVGGTWTAELPASAGKQKIETRYVWADNQAYVRFTTHFVSASGTLNNYDGSFYWDRAAGSLRTWYMAASGEITTAPVTADTGGMVMLWRGPDMNGAVADLRVTVRRADANTYAWIFEERDASGKWVQGLTLTYRRSAASR